MQRAPADEQRRRYVRHPILVPIVVHLRNHGGDLHSRVADISEGGVAFTSTQPLNVGNALDVELPVEATRFKLTGKVASCNTMPDGYFRVGVAFVEAAMSFRMKLAEQVLRISQLQKRLTRERGVPVSQQEAAQIWVEQYAATFADLLPHS